MTSRHIVSLKRKQLLKITKGQHFEVKILTQGKLSPSLWFILQFKELNMQRNHCHGHQYQPIAGTVIGNARMGTAEKFPLHFEGAVEHLMVDSGNENYFLKQINRKGNLRKNCLKIVDLD